MLVGVRLLGCQHQFSKDLTRVCLFDTTLSVSGLLLPQNKKPEGHCLQRLQKSKL